ncbi:E3 ubiquitin-protein ligase E3D-like [Anneissia japonica]|uniref:E3 ubiquitin-protein ligase E3D-like n=1 Tax=Anneissia japonica TaxID=1529436 RepID=UPI001425A500|nr:E3 ubiquitin-protein ligase E3D-like [Anneissia japonica]
MNVYGEIREHIQSLQLVVCLPLEETLVDVKISDDEIEVDNRRQKMTFILPNIQLIPNSCHNLSWVKSEGAHMIFRVKDHTVSEGENATGSLEDALMDSNCQIVCATCRKSILTSQCKFDRVCQLPSDHWQEMVEDWQCHASQDVAQIACKTLEPSSNDCFMDSTSLIVSPKVINKDAFRSTDGILTLKNKHKMDGSRDKYLTCRRCCSLIGRVSCKAIMKVI